MYSKESVITVLSMAGCNSGYLQKLLEKFQGISSLKCETSGPHGDEDVDVSLVGCKAV
jgi:hypothetical protein